MKFLNLKFIIGQSNIINIYINNYNYHIPIIISIFFFFFFFFYFNSIFIFSYIYIIKIYHLNRKFQKQINISKYNKWLKNGRPVYEIPINNINSKVEELLSSRINTYDFENDECFQNGISTLKDRFKDNEEHLNIALNNAKVFYLKKYVKKNNNKMIKYLN